MPRKKVTINDFDPEGFNDSSLSNKQTSQQQTESDSNMKSPIKYIISGIVVLVFLVVALISVKLVTVTGNELGVKETWSGGVDTNIYQPKTYWLIPGWSQTIIKYDASSQVFVMNDKPMHIEKSATGREKDAYLVQSQEGQDMYVSLNLRWRINPEKLISMHKTVRKDIEEKIIRPVVMRVVKDEATKLKAIEAYSGEGLVKLQASIQNSLSGEGEGKELAQRGVTVENFVIEHIKLDEKYIEEIKGKQIAMQKALRAIEEQKAAEEKAKVAKSEAMSEYNTKLVAQMLLATNMVIQAQADNQKVVIAATAAAEQVTINAKAQATQVTVAAEAQKKQMELEGEGQKLKLTAESEGTLAMGKAKATANQLLIDSYKTAGPNAYVAIQVASSLADGTKGIQGYLPNNFNPTILSENFVGAMTAIMKPLVVPPMSLGQPAAK